MQQVFAELNEKIRSLDQQLTLPWGFCERPENSDICVVEDFVEDGEWQIFFRRMYVVNV